jgi:hypothetical protein
MMGVLFFSQPRTPNKNPRTVTLIQVSADASLALNAPPAYCPRKSSTDTPAWRKIVRSVPYGMSLGWLGMVV